MKKTYTAFVEYDDESKLYAGIVPNVPGILFLNRQVASFSLATHRKDLKGRKSFMLKSACTSSIHFT